MADPKPLTRNELAEFLPSQRAIRAFEKLFALFTNDPESLTTRIQEVSVDAGSAVSKAQQALDYLERIATALELLALAPKPLSVESDILAQTAVSSITVDDLAPAIPLGTLGMQQATNVAITGGTVQAQLKNNQTILLESTVALANGAAAAAGTITNAPAAGNPTKWVAISDNGTTRYIPAW